MKSYKPSNDPLTKRMNRDVKKKIRERLADKVANPTELNWVDRGVVTSMKDQGSCGSCWAFGSIAQAESTLILNGQADINIDLSEQYMVECTRDSDCDGTYYVEYPMEQILNGVPTEESYPYQPFTTHSGICTTSDRVHISDDFIAMYDLTDAEIIDMLQYGPLTCTISADDWDYYDSGIFSCSSYAQINHVVLLVGYTSSYWIIKNQWGTSWGEDGYMKISRSSNSNCRIGVQLFMFEQLQCN